MSVAATVPARIRRTPEIVLMAIGMAGSLVVMGGFALVMNSIDRATFAEVVMPSLSGAGAEVAEAFAAARTLGAWFGISVVLVLLLGAAGIAVARSRPRRRTAAWLALAAGLVCLLGSQLVMFPIAFLFFLAAGLFVLRPRPHERSR